MLSPRLAGALLIGCLLAGCSDDGRSVEAYCEAVSTFQRDSGDFDPAGFRALIDTAPSAVEDDLQRVGDVLEVLDGLGETDADYAKAQELTEDADFLAAGERADAYTLENCGVSLADVEPDPDPITPVEVFGIDESEIASYLDDDFEQADGIVGRRLIGGGSGVISIEVDTIARGAMAGCLDLSAWLADHPDASGTVVVEVIAVELDADGIPGPDRTTVRSGSIQPGDPSTCVEQAT